MKRFTDTEKWTSKPWFRRLPPRLKCLWAFFCETCDPAGVIAPDWEIASLQIGEAVSEDDLSAFGSRVMKLENGKFWVVKFIDFQYGELSLKCRPHDRVFASIRKNRIPYPNNPDTLSDRVSQRVCNTLVEEEEDKYKEEEEDRKGVKGETIAPPVSASVVVEAITAEQIVSAYPRRESVAEALKIVSAALRKGVDAETMLAGTRAIASVISTLPSQANNAFVVSAETFFLKERWRDDPATWSRRSAKTANGEQPGQLNLGGRKFMPTPTPTA